MAENEILKLKERISCLEFQVDALQNKDNALVLKQQRYTLEDISEAFSLYSAGPRCYKLLRLKGHTLPSPSTLRRWASTLCVEPGIQSQILTQMRTFDLQVEEKLCVISFDEMKCREEWAYDRKNDIVLEPKRMI